MPSKKFRREFNPDKKETTGSEKLPYPSPTPPKGFSLGWDVVTTCIFIVLIIFATFFGILYLNFKDGNLGTASETPIPIPGSQEPPVDPKKPRVELGDSPSYSLPVNHYMAIDYSESANNDDAFRILRSEFCKTSIQQYRVGDQYFLFKD